MKNSLLFCVMITLLVLCSALFARYGSEKRNNDAVAAMSYMGKEDSGAGITFTDLAQRVDSVLNGGKA